MNVILETEKVIWKQVWWKRGDIGAGQYKKKKQQQDLIFL